MDKPHAGPLGYGMDALSAGESRFQTVMDYRNAGIASEYLTGNPASQPIPE